MNFSENFIDNLWKATIAHTFIVFKYSVLLPIGRGGVLDTRTKGSLVWFQTVISG